MTIDTKIGLESMPNSTAIHARRFLDVADPDAQALALLRAALRSSTRSRAGWPTLERLERWTVDQLDLIDVEPETALENDKVLDVLAAVRMVAARVPSQSRLPSGRRFHHGVAAILDSLEPTFVPELLRETRRRRDDDPAFAAHLVESRRAVANLLRRASALQAEVVKSVPAEVADDPERPVVLQETSEQQAANVVVAVFVIALLTLVTIAYIAYNDPAKDPEAEDEEDEE